MTTKFVVDASVAMKWFIPEVHSAAAERLLHSRFDVSAPDLIRPGLRSNCLFLRAEGL